jgi:hypothetical protein
MKRLPEITFIQFTNPEGYPPLEHASTILSEAEYACTFLARSNHLTGRIKFQARPNRRVLFLPRWLKIFPTKLEYVLYSIWVLMHVIVRKPVWVYCSDLNSTLVGIVLKKMGSFVVYHEHDAPETNGNGLLHSMRLKLLASADVVIAPNRHRFRENEKKLLHNRFFEVRNVPSKKEAFELSDWRSPHIRLVYFGTIVPSRLPIDFIAAIVRNKQTINVDLIGYETSESMGYVKILINLTKKSDVTITHYEAMPRKEMLTLAAKADAGLLFFSDVNGVNEGNMLGASNKLFDYHLAGLPIIHNSIEIQQHTHGLPGFHFLNDYDDLAAVLSGLKVRYQSKGVRQSLQDTIHAGNNYECEFSPVLKRLAQQ